MRFPNNYKTLIVSGVTTLLMTFLVVQLGYLILDSGDMNKLLFIISNFLGFIITWYVLYALMNSYPISKVLGVIGLLVTAILAERFLQISDNPITIPFLILFWLGLTYLILPQFFKKYQIGILSIYGLIIGYYLIGFITASDYGGEDRQIFSKYMLMPIPVFAALWIYEQWRWVKGLKADRARAELNLLKSQVNPHFFFNTLNNLYGLVVEKSTQAPDVVLQLSEMMRYTIDMGKEDEVNIMDEVRYLKNYIALHKIRYQKIVDIRFEHKVNNGTKVAPLLFINLLENSFKHGVESQTENAFIHMSLKEEGNRLLFEITNNFEAKVQTEEVGTGLDNLKKRLVHSYPKNHELVIDKTDDTFKVHLSLVLNAKLTQ